VSPNIAASVRQRLKNRAQVEDRLFNDLLQHYVLERFLYRLGKSQHNRRFILKGALLFSVWQGPLMRPTHDIDLAGRTVNTPENIARLIKDICRETVMADDGLVFLPDSVKVADILEKADYNGRRVTLTAMLGKARAPFQIDIGFGDPIVTSPVKMQLPTLLDFPPPELLGYDRETVIAEKYQAMVHFNELNSRLKDFYDVWFLAAQFEFEGQALAQSIRATFLSRKTDLIINPTAFSAHFAHSADKQKQWSAFLSQRKIGGAPADLGEVIEALNRFLQPITQALIESQDFKQHWPRKGPWQDRQK
jgi:hypothetical protein